MAFGTSLLNLRTMLRAEVAQSLNMAQGVNSQTQYDMMLNRVQKELWEQYEWPHLRYFSTVALADGQRLYPYPVEMPFDYIINGYVLASANNWAPLAFGIDLVDYAQYAEGTKGWPVQKWGNVPTVTAGITSPVGQIEVWPVPNQAGELKFRGQAPATALVLPTDLAVLDDTLLTLFAASEILASHKAEHSALKLQKANQFLRRHFANLGGSTKKRIPVLGGQGSMPGGRSPVAGLDFIPPGYNG